MQSQDSQFWSHWAAVVPVMAEVLPAASDAVRLDAWLLAANEHLPMQGYPLVNVT